MADAAAPYVKVVDVAPSAKLSTTKNETRSELINRILIALSPADRIIGEWVRSDYHFTNRLTTNTNLSYLRKVLDLSLIVASRTDPRTAELERKFVMLGVRGVGSKIGPVHTNREFLTEMRMEELDFLISGLSRLKYSSGERIPTLAVHHRVEKVFDDNVSIGDHLMTYGRSSLMPFVEDSPHLADEAIELLHRGIKAGDIPDMIRAMEFGKSKSLQQGAL